MAAEATNQRPSFVSLGMVVLDELRFPDRPSLYDVAGGSGAFSVLGARLVAGEDRASQVGCFILAGNDFPESAVKSFKSWGVNLDIRVDSTRQSTRGLLEYKDTAFGRKTFRYTTTPLHPSPKDLPAHFLETAAFHILALPSQLKDHIADLASTRPNASSLAPPILVWEPTPPYCKQDTREEHIAAAKLVDVFSPNHLELLAFFEDNKQSAPDAADFDPQAIEACADVFIDAGIGPSGRGTIVVRAGEHGCLVSSAAIEGRHRWLPAYCSDASAVVDATGGGNTFLGAFTFAMAACGKDAVGAAEMANVAASFSLEQIGTPKLQQIPGQRERWNDSTFDDRYQAYQKILGR